MLNSSTSVILIHILYLWNESISICSHQSYR